jgi:hypothetical protein
VSVLFLTNHSKNEMSHGVGAHVQRDAAGRGEGTFVIASMNVSLTARQESGHKHSDAGGNCKRFPETVANRTGEKRLPITPDMVKDDSTFEPEKCN